MPRPDKITPATIEDKLNAHVIDDLPEVKGYRLFTILYNQGQNVTAIAKAFGKSFESMKKYIDAETEKRRDGREALDKLKRL